MSIYSFSAAFKIIKALLPPKAVAALRFVNSKSLGEYITKENMLTCWGGTDDYQYQFEDERSIANDTIITTDQNDNTIDQPKKVSKFFFMSLASFQICFWNNTATRIFIFLYSTHIVHGKVPYNF